MVNVESLKESIGVDVILKPYFSSFTTFCLGGPCRSMIMCDRAKKLEDALLYFSSYQEKDYLVIGEGSNLLVSDQGVDRYVIRYFSKTSYFEQYGDEIVVEACSRLDHLALTCAQQGLSGLGFASGIPGSVGGAVVGNAGAFGHEMRELIKTVDVLDAHGQPHTLDANDCGFSYRHSRFKDSGEVILRVRLKLKKGSAALLLEERKTILLERKDKHPNYHVVPCAGSFFKNMEPLNPGERRQAAGFFLDQAGAKSLVVGGAGVYEKHANILVKKTKECTAQDVYLLSQKMRNLVKEKFGITLEREVRLIGNF